MKIRLYNARIMTMAEGCSLLQGEIWVENDRILYVGDGTDLDAFCKRTGIPGLVADKEIDCEGNVLMPGFKDAHTHSAMVAMRSFAACHPQRNAWPPWPCVPLRMTCRCRNG